MRRSPARLPVVILLELLLLLLLCLAGRGAAALSDWWQRRYAAGIVGVTAVGSRVEIELYSTKAPRSGAMFTWLRLGDHDVYQWAVRHDEPGRGRGAYVAVLAAEEFAALPDGAPVAFMYGSPGGWAYRDIDFGRLDKRLLRAGPSGPPPAPAPGSPGRAPTPGPE